MEDPLKAYNDVLKIAKEEADYDPKGDFCAKCGTVFEDRGECKVCGGEVEAGWVNPETGKMQKEMPDKVQFIDDSDYASSYREDLYGKLDDKEFAGANDEIEEEDGLDEDRVEIDIGGDDVEIEDFDDDVEIEDFDDDVEIEDFDDVEIDDERGDIDDWEEVENIANEFGQKCKKCGQDDSDHRYHTDNDDNIHGNITDHKFVGESKANEDDPDFDKDPDHLGFVKGVQVQPSQYTQSGLDHDDPNRGDVDFDSLGEAGGESLTQEQKKNLSEWVKENPDWTSIDDLPDDMSHWYLQHADSDTRIDIMLEILDLMEKYRS